MADITIRAMGAKGVNVDADPLLLDDAELRDSQNMFHDISDAHGGGLKNRNGFTQFIAAPLGGSILGGLGMAVAGVAKATGAGPGPGTGTGPGDGGGPGTTGPTGTNPPQTGGFSTGTRPFGGARIIVIGRSSGQSSTRYGTSWFLTSENMANAAIISTGPPGPPNAFGIAFNSQPAGPRFLSTPAVRLNGYLYYSAGITDTSAGQRPTIRKTNGYSDELVATVPKATAATGTDSQIVSMAENGEFIWITETTNTVANPTGATATSRLFRLDPSTKALVDCLITGSSGGAGYVFNPVIYDGSRMFVGEATPSVSGTANLIPIVPTATGAVIDTAVGSLSFGPPERQVLSLGVYDANLYAGTRTATSGVFAHVYQLSLSAAGVWTGSQILTGTGGTGVIGNCFPSMTEFKSNLYVSFYASGSTARIYKYDGVTGTEVFANSGAADLRAFYLSVDKDTMYAIGVEDSITTGSHCFLKTTDGSSWANQTATVAAQVAGILAFPLLYGFEQS